MKTKLVLQNVPSKDLSMITRDFQHEGAKVTVTPNRGRDNLWTVEAVFDKDRDDNHTTPDPHQRMAAVG